MAVLQWWVKWFLCVVWWNALEYFGMKDVHSRHFPILLSSEPLIIFRGMFSHLCKWIPVSGFSVLREPKGTFSFWVDFTHIPLFSLLLNRIVSLYGNGLLVKCTQRALCKKTTENKNRQTMGAEHWRWAKERATDPCLRSAEGKWPLLQLRE